MDLWTNLKDSLRKANSSVARERVGCPRYQARRKESRNKTKRCELTSSITWYDPTGVFHKDKVKE